MTRPKRGKTDFRCLSVALIWRHSGCTLPTQPVNQVWVFSSHQEVWNVDSVLVGVSITRSCDYNAHPHTLTLRHSLYPRPGWSNDGREDLQVERGKWSSRIHNYWIHMKSIQFVLNFIFGVLNHIRIREDDEIAFWLDFAFWFVYFTFWFIDDELMRYSWDDARTNLGVLYNYYWFSVKWSRIKIW